MEAPAEPAGTVLGACHSSPPVPEEPAVLLAAFRNLLLPGQPHAQPCWVLCISEGCGGPSLGTAASGVLGVRVQQGKSDDTVQVRAKPAAVKHPGTTLPQRETLLFAEGELPHLCL